MILNPFDHHVCLVSGLFLLRSLTFLWRTRLSLRCIGSGAPNSLDRAFGAIKQAQNILSQFDITLAFELVSPSDHANNRGKGGGNHCDITKQFNHAHRCLIASCRSSRGGIYSNCAFCSRRGQLVL